MIDTTKVLPVGTVLRSQSRAYTIVNVIGQGGFGITYHATAVVTIDNIKAEAHFAIKEHFVDRYCEREGATQTVSYSRPVAKEVENSRKDFLSEARRLRDLSRGQKRHPNIVCVNETFEANNTAYYVMEYLKGESLSDYVKRVGPLNDTEMRQVMRPIIDAVAFLHKEYITHLDIKPANIMLTRDDKGKLRPVLIDFGLSRHFDPETEEPSSSIQQAGFSAGYAPIEQVQAFSHFYPGTDVYSLGATMLYALTGQTPAPAENLDDEMLRGTIPAGLPDSTVLAITESMRIYRKHRPENAAALLAILCGDDSTRIIAAGRTTGTLSNREATIAMPTRMPPPPASSPISEPIEEPEAKSKKGLYIFLSVLAVLCILCAALFTKGFGLLDDEKNEKQQPYHTTSKNLDTADDELVASPYDEAVEGGEKIAAPDVDFEGADMKNVQDLVDILPQEEEDYEKEIIAQDEIPAGTPSDYGVDDLTKPAVKHEIVEERPREEVKPKPEETVNMAMVEQKPQFPGGDAAMYRWMSNNMVYPAQASEEGIQGKVYVQFVVEKDGSITNVRIARSKHQALDLEALRVVRTMPRWTPGFNNGQPVRVTYILPVTFKLQ